MKTITKKELIDMVNDIKGVTFVSVLVHSEPKMRKTDNPYLGATKVVTLSGAIGFDYQNSVNLQLGRENKDTDFVAQPRSWGTHEKNWITHKGNYYLSVKVQGTSDSDFIYEGNKINKDILEPFLYESKKPHTQEALDTAVTVRDVKIDNIKCIRAFGEEFVVI